MLFKILHGDDSRISTEITPFHEGYCYVTHGGYIYVDINVGTVESPNNQRIKLNANQAESITGYDIATILNSSDVEIPTSKAIKTYVDDAVANVSVEVDTTLTQSGKAADAKAVGDALENISYNDLIDKPFGEVVEQLGDTLTWDGDLENFTGVKTEPVTVSETTSQYVRVSSSVPSISDIVSESYVIYVTVNGNGRQALFAKERKDWEISLETSSGSEIGVIILEDNHTRGSFLFPEKGVYFNHHYDIETNYYEYTKRITVPGYNFVNTTTKKIDKKYFPVDSTFTEYGIPADAKSVGDALENKANKTDLNSLATKAELNNYATKGYVDNAVANVSVEVDATLTQQGKAADAKAVGDKLAEYAKTTDLTNYATKGYVTNAIANAGMSGGGGGGSSIIDITELPTEDIIENAIYRTEHTMAYDGVKIYFVDGSGGEPMDLQEVMELEGASVSVYLVDDAQTQNMTISTTSNMYWYVDRATGVAYSDFGAGVWTAGYALGLEYSAEFQDHGWSTDISSETAVGIYCVAVSNDITYYTYHTHKNGAWTELSGSGIVEVESLPSDRVNENLIYRTCNEMYTNVSIYLVDGSGNPATNLVDMAKQENVTLHVSVINNAETSSLKVSTETDMYLFIDSNSGIAYCDFGYGVWTIGYAFGLMYSLEVPDNGWSTDITSETEPGFYCTMETTQYYTYYTYANGRWTELTSGGIINVEQLPSGDVDENKIYRVKGPGGGSADIWVLMGSEPTNLSQAFIAQGAKVETVVVTELPANMRVTVISDDMVGTEIYVYVLESTGIAYVEAGLGEPLPLGYALSEGILQDKGWSEDIMSETEYGVYCVRTSGNVGSSYHVYSNGVWAELSVDSAGGSKIELDTSLSQEGMAADAMAVGDALSTLNDGKVDKVYGKNLSTNDFTDAYKQQLDALTNSYGTGLKLSLNNDGTYAVVGVLSVPCTELAIPSTVNGKTVTKIGNSAFAGCSNLTSIKIPDSITSIGERAFWGCTNLTSITIPDSVTSIGGRAFWGCSRLESITLPFIGDSIKTENDNNQYPFGYIFGSASSYEGGVVISQSYYTTPGSDMGTSYCIPASLRSVTITGGNILYGAFYNCSMLESITIPDNVTKIGERAFYGCSSLSSFTVPNSVTNIGDFAFYGCSAITDVYVNVETWLNISFGSGAYPSYTAYNLRMHLLDDNRNEVTDLVVPSKITSIDYYIFKNCSELLTITVPDSVTNINRQAFSKCSSLESITLPFLGANKDDVANAKLGHIFGSNELTPDTLKSVTITGGTSIIDRAFYGCGDSLMEINLPDSITSIGERAFYWCSGLTNLVVPENVTSIGEYAFYGCVNLAEVTMPTRVTSIGEYAFGDCRSLISIVIPSGITTIPKSLFYNCHKLGSVTVPTGITTIGESAFAFCYDLTEVTIPNGVTTIEFSAFYNCTGLQIIKIPSSVTSIGFSAFYKCENIADIYVYGLETWLNIVFDDDYSAYPNYYAGRLHILNDDGSEVTHLNITSELSTKQYLFWGWTGTTITISDDITSLPGGMFVRCDNLESITMPYVSCTYSSDLEMYGFHYLFSLVPKTLETIQLTTGSILDTGFFASCPNVRKIVLPDTITSIEAAAFAGCENLVDITLPNGLTNIGGSIFQRCGSLTNIIIPDTVTDIGAGIFDGCTGLENITIPFLGATADAVENADLYYLFNNHSGNKNLKTVTITGGTTVGGSAFMDCTTITEINLPDSITSIGQYAFARCTGLTSIVIPESVENIGLGALIGCENLEHVTVPFIGSKRDDPENTHFSYILGNMSPTTVLYKTPESLQSITVTYCPELGDYAFAGNTSLVNLTLPNTVNSIGGHAFYGCTSLRTAIIPNGVTSIADEAFYGCTLITDVIIPDTVTSIGVRTFYNCTNATNIVIPDSVTSIGQYAFANCTSLTSITIPDSVTSIDYYAFQDCSSLKSITIPFVGTKKDGTGALKFNSLFGRVPETLTTVILDGATNIPDSAFASSSHHMDIIIPNTVTSIDYGAFRYYYTLKNITIPSSVTTIANRAFYGCTSLTEIVIPEGVTSIGNEAFNNCTSVTELTIPSSLTEIGTNVFCNCDITKLTIPGSLTHINSGLFQLCSNLKEVVIEPGVETIGDYVFMNSENISSVIIPATVTSMGEKVFGGCTNATIYCEAESKPEGWNENWNPDNRPVVWGFAPDLVGVNEKLNDIEQSITDNAVIINSSTEGSTKRFKITVDDSGTITATEVV